MAVTYSTEYTNAFITTPAVPNYGNVDGGFIRYKKFTYTQAANGAAADIVYLVQVPANSVVIMGLSRLQWNATAGPPTISLGWLAYTAPDGSAVAASATGLLNALAVTTAAGEWVGGVLNLAGGVVRAAPVIETKEFNSREPVTLFATYNTNGAPANTQLNGHVAYALA